jgi:sulfite reductase alpha subunit-like flavoprotein
VFLHSKYTGDLGYNTVLLETIVGTHHCCLFLFLCRYVAHQCVILFLYMTIGNCSYLEYISTIFRLQKSLPNNLFQNLSIAMFSLGDRCYGPDKFCAAGRKLIVRLRQLGATLLVQPGYGDDNTPNGGIFIDLDQWLYCTLLPHLFPQMATNNEPNVIGLVSTKIDNIHNNGDNPVSQRHPLYHITVVSDDIVNGEAKLVLIEEWDKEQYRAEYNEFFERQGPPNAYRYSMQSKTQNFNFDHNLPGRRDIVRQPRFSTNDNRRHNTDPDGNESSILLGHVVENRRLTATSWEQNTRHLRLDVSVPIEGMSNSEAEAEVRNRSNSNNPNVVVHENLGWSLDKLPYQAGDVAAVMPSNTVQEVNSFLSVLPKHLQQLADCELLIQFNSDHNDTSVIFSGVGYRHWPAKCTLRGLLTYCADIHALPEREDLRALAQYSSHHLSGKQQHDKLISLSETKDSALYVDYILREKRSWVDVLYDFDSLRDDKSNLTIEAILGLLLPIRPRLFSIASSPTKDWMDRNMKSSTLDTFTVELCVGVVEGKTRHGRKFHGLCSNYLANVTPTTSTIRLWIQPGSFHGLPLPVQLVSTANVDANMDLSQHITPIICIGAGTGVAPLRAMIQERDAIWHLKNFEVISKTSEFNRPCRNALLFGCRKKDADFYYSDEWMMLERSGMLQLLTAFSQDQRNKVYVQHVLESEKFGHNNIVKHLIDDEGAIYIAGGPKMARAVNDVIVEALCRVGSCSDEKAARKTLSKIQNMGLYSVEAWS